MGESSACLVRSFSQPSPTSSEEKKGNPLQRALTTSISFGRFMSESLDWERWSAFTQNRHLEEVERYSKPGSVAEKKAYFEAHFKRRRAAALLEQQNTATSDFSETNTNNEVEDNSCSDLNLGQRDRVTETVKEREVQNNDPVLPVGQNGSYDASKERALENVDMVTQNVKEVEVQTNGLVFPISQNGSHDACGERTLKDAQPGGVEEVTVPPVLLEHPKEVTNDAENDVSILSKKEDNTCNKGDSSMRNSTSSHVKKPEVSSKCSSSVKSVMPIQLRNSEKTPKSKNNAMDSSNKRRSYTTSLHMSINFASCSVETQKATSPGPPKIAKSRLIRAPVKKYKNSLHPQTSTRASTNGIFKHHSAIPPTENRRTITSDGDTDTESRTVDGKLQSVSTNCSKSSNFIGSKARLPALSSSFTFKSEERAAKRKEFYQKLEQKSTSKEAEKQQLHAKSQVKARSTSKGLCESVASKATKDAEVPRKVEVASNLTRKIPTVRPRSPRITERSAFRVRDNDSRPPWRLSVKPEGLKDVTVKHSRPPSYSLKQISKKSMNENASPNIQLSLN